jgi:deoxyribonuclease V
MPSDLIGRLPDLWRETYDLVAQVPLGKVTTYGEVARALGDIVASRFVGLAMSRNDDIVRVPCRRVVQTDGQVGGYTGGGPAKKIRLLRGEGIRIEGSKVVDLEQVLFKEFTTRYPLAKLRQKQVELKRRLILREHRGPIESVAGIDVAYSGDRAFAAMVIFDYKTGEEVERHMIEGEARFPYVPTYLAFREIPVIRPLMRHIKKGTILMFDGNGVLHPLGFGVTSQIGVVFDLPTVGVAKKLLCGSVSGKSIRGVREVRDSGGLVGYAISKTSGGKPVFVSAGHRVSSAQARDIALRFLIHRVPEPTRLAHIAAGEARRGANGK